jgi:hypothetical protein
MVSIDRRADRERVRHEPVRFAMDPRGRLLFGRIDETEDLTRGLVDPP